MLLNFLANIFIGNHSLVLFVLFSFSSSFFPTIQSLLVENSTTEFEIFNLEFLSCSESNSQTDGVTGQTDQKWDYVRDEVVIRDPISSIKECTNAVIELFFLHCETRAKN